MSSVKMALGALVLALVGLSQSATAGDCCCECGNSNCGVRKVCRLVKETKKIEKICYGCECEDYCLPGKSCKGCLNSESTCDDECGDCCTKSCDSCECKDHKPACCLCWFDWTPTCAKVKTRKKLVKYVVTKEIPSWKWKVEEVCAGCCPDNSCTGGADGGVPVQTAGGEYSEAVEADAQIPPVPSVNPISHRKAR